MTAAPYQAESWRTVILAQCLADTSRVKVLDQLASKTSRVCLLCSPCLCFLDLSLSAGSHFKGPWEEVFIPFFAPCFEDFRRGFGQVLFQLPRSCFGFWSSISYTLVPVLSLCALQGGGIGGEVGGEGGTLSSASFLQSAACRSCHLFYAVKWATFSHLPAFLSHPKTFAKLTSWDCFSLNVGLRREGRGGLGEFDEVEWRRDSSVLHDQSTVTMFKQDTSLCNHLSDHYKSSKNPVGLFKINFAVSVLCDF